MGGPFELVFWIKNKTFSGSSHLDFPKYLQNKNILTQGYILHFIFVPRFPNETPTLGDCWLLNDDTLGHLLFWGDEGDGGWNGMREKQRGIREIRGQVCRLKNWSSSCLLEQKQREDNEVAAQ